MKLKQIIQDLFHPSFNSNASKELWWVKKGYKNEYNLLFEKTSFLEKDTKFSERLYNYFHDLNTVSLCNCGNKLRYVNFTIGYASFCSLKCSNSSDVVKQKHKETCMVKYGVDNPSKCVDVKKKIRESTESNWPDDNKCNWKQSVITKRKQKIESGTYLKEELIYHYDFSNPFLLNHEKNYECKKCNHLFIFEDWMYHNDALRCPKCFPKWSSSYERKIREFIQPLNITYSIDNRKIITPKELDIYFEDQKLAIEIHGLLWHSFGKSGKSYINNAHIEDKNYHLNKTQKCEEKDIKLLQIFQNELDDENKFNIWKSIILTNLGKNEVIYARKCQIREVDSKESAKFLEDNHLQGNVGSSIRLGLYYENELVCLLGFAKPRFNKNYDWEITRFANKKFISVVGGFSKLLSYFRKNYSGSIITYADRRYSNGDLYRKNGFIELKDSAPNYFYFTLKELKLLSRVQFQKHKLEEKLEIFDPNLSESENMFNNGYRRIWDCGNKVFILN